MKSRISILSVFLIVLSVGLISCHKASAAGKDCSIESGGAFLKIDQGKAHTSLVELVHSVCAAGDVIEVPNGLIVASEVAALCDFSKAIFSAHDGTVCILRDTH